MIRTDATAREVKLMFDFVCPETDREVVRYELPFRDTELDWDGNDGYYDPPRIARVHGCPACGQSHAIDV